MSIIKKLSDTIRRKFVEIFDCSMWQIENDEGWADIETINKTQEYQRYVLHFKSGNILECADNHIIITKDYEQVFAKDSLGKEILTKYGTDVVVQVQETDIWENMYDFSLSEESNHLYYSNGILSHNSTLMTIYALWLANFFPDQAIIVCAHKGETARMLFERIKLAYKELPNWIKEPVLEWNKSSMRLANGSTITTTNTTAEGPRGNSLSCLILDEFAFVAPEIAEKFWTSVTPTLTNNPDARMFVSSTPNGIGNMFHLLYDQAQNGKNEFVIQKVIWSDVPGRDAEWRKKTIETDCLGNEEMFAQEYECKFLGANNSPFPPSTFEKIQKDISDPIMRDMDGYLKIWKLPENDRVYTIGVDVSEGVGMDSSVVQVMDITDLNAIEQVACYANDRIDPTAFTEVVEQISTMYGKPVLAVERNGCGSGVCDRLYIDKSYPHFVCHGNDQNKKSRAGISSSQNIKGPACTNMKYWLSDKKQVIMHDAAFLESLHHFIRKSTGKWQAETNWHDDLEMALVWALYPLHRDLVKTYFVVCGEHENGKPQRVMNRFKYILDPNDKHLLSSRFAKYGQFNVMSFGRISHRRFRGINMDKYKDSFTPPKTDPFKNIKKKYKDFDDNPSWMFDK